MRSLGDGRSEKDLAVHRSAQHAEKTVKREKRAWREKGVVLIRREFHRVPSGNRAEEGIGKIKEEELPLKLRR